eukprot:SAG11_NODE_1586_length_4636_cov_9.336125_3_plen_167_part_00
MAVRAKLTDGAKAINNADGWGVAALVGGSANAEMQFDLDNDNDSQDEYYEICGIGLTWETGANAHWATEWRLLGAPVGSNAPSVQWISAYAGLDYTSALSSQIPGMGSEVAPTARSLSLCITTAPGHERSTAVQVVEATDGTLELGFRCRTARHVKLELLQSFSFR